MTVREKMRKIAIFCSNFNQILNAVMIQRPITSVDWNEKIAPAFRNIEDLLNELLQRPNKHAPLSHNTTTNGNAL